MGVNLKKANHESCQSMSARKIRIRQCHISPKNIQKNSRTSPKFRNSKMSKKKVVSTVDLINIKSGWSLIYDMGLAQFLPKCLAKIGMSLAKLSKLALNFSQSTDFGRDQGFVPHHPQVTLLAGQAFFSLFLSFKRSSFAKKR